MSTFKKHVNRKHNNDEIFEHELVDISDNNDDIFEHKLVDIPVEENLVSESSSSTHKLIENNNENSSKQPNESNDQKMSFFDFQLVKRHISGLNQEIRYLWHNIQHRHVGKFVSCFKATSTA